MEIVRNPIINCEIELSLTWDPNCILSNLVGNSTFTITDTKRYVPVVTLKTEDNTKLSKLLSKGFKYKYIYKTKTGQKYHQDKVMIILLVVY